MSTSQNISHSNSLLMNLKQQQQERIDFLENQVKQLQEEIRLILEFHDRIDDL
jgi:polyhydroxyalkanoate synthesis regulator phasin